ncbi:MAG: alkylated DNA repair dioxygenase AlkB [Planctomycetota bacterium]|jgi:alkylated DNA repair dioxygenase AlkB
MQADLFSDGEPVVETFDVPDAEIWLMYGLLSKGAGCTLFDALHANTPWEQDPIQMYGRKLLSPRLTAWYGDPGSEYKYSGVSHCPRRWTPELSQLKKLVEAATKTCFNSALLTLYRDGDDSVGWHSDDEIELGRCPKIASVSIGVERSFQLKHKSLEGAPRLDLELPAGSLLWMAGECQHAWVHQVPKRRRVHSARINITFRCVSV